MIITPLESIENLKKRMKKFNYASLYGTLIKYSSPFGVGHAYLVSYSKSSIIYNKDLKIEPLYEEISNFHTTESRTTIFQESETIGNYTISGEISYIYKDELGNSDLLVVSCKDLTFYIDRQDFKTILVKTGDWVIFNITSLEFYDLEID